MVNTVDTREDMAVVAPRPPEREREREREGLV